MRNANSQISMEPIGDQITASTKLGMASYKKYLATLKSLINSEASESREAIDHALNGQAYGSLRNLIDLQTLRTSGAFFTGHEVANRLVDRARLEIRSGASFIDPACGAGNLLLAGARHLPLYRTLSETLREWSKVIYGFDLHPEFVEATKLRLVLLAKQLGNFSERSVPIDSLFPNIVCGDALSPDSHYPEDVSIVLLNPPYSSMAAPSKCTWGTGKISSAAVFLEHVISHAPIDGRIYSILPEVLRCGSRYNAFRRIITSNSESVYEESLGVFDKWTDIDVYATEIVKRAIVPELIQQMEAVESVGDRFEIHVGTVVDYRSPKEGHLYPYLETKQATPWSKNFICSDTRRFNGTVFQPPFVVIRRTSRPGDKFRAIGTIVRGNAPVAVENHLIVAKPMRNTVKQCLELLKVLRLPSTSEYLDIVMRCRHLTVTSVKSIPWVAND
ncbi:N-6 DNA methylase [Mariprofundus ferrooxydans]|uniref:N-6 DNA methylase n=1 Tax=Mariprofundus ferrooxydans TaxID=314344 RepID=UPI000399F8AE|nr:N-6 DNA methylase [Mariprofundus ferrooxydans]